MSDQPTRDEVLKVRRHECRMSGHSWSAVLVVGQQDPRSFICDRCGRQLMVVGDGIDHA